MSAPDWLTARPVAHRGLHDAARGILENMPGAVQAAIAGNFSIEVDIQLTADGEAMVHHDNALGRLTEGSGALLGKTAAELKAVKFKNTPERMMTLSDLCALVAGRVPLVIEVKSHFDGDRRLVKRMAEVLATYSGPAVGMSFDPDQVLALRELIPSLPRGIVAEREYTEDEWPEASAAQRRGMTHLRHAFRTRPHFVAYWVNELPAAAPWIARNIFGLPLLTWTVRTPDQRASAARYADQMIFEGFVP
ncbi:glycerophosphodiester phosphodiesterase [Bradyrhizobium sp. AUGA SZCCT0240]|uniref:glycerophosphodiester phosphodiesterase n=1 Tax=unclassified Bradyrhizobium TaxID=2631580 RepID=UPI001BA50187|nr:MULTISPECIES: glycerophosphodiester phosphodiesterase [unclassified Bradyrhizobium]MBR1197542.1 glycerophosphodiester phosphodiesterase [Bradyrhizobium sp. AUGA SZCCT0158]MBR1244281.1 glycerophosphodiester phosphodiesterase [Bradyrhizobium sp. AUGA SZCCT0274]MBR1254598.1 glycerophosphodiester phosphodiesterase [Bradyrhizobium sp. AUGA SZCCT0240]